MNQIVLYTVISLSATGIAAAVILYLIAQRFRVIEDPRIDEVEDVLPSANCGGCGFTGCAAAAAAVVYGKAKPTVCVIGGMESAASVAGVMGLDPGSVEPLKSVNTCSGGDRAEDKFYYMGIPGWWWVPVVLVSFRWLGIIYPAGIFPGICFTREW